MSHLHALFTVLPKAGLNGSDFKLNILHVQIMYWLSFGFTQLQISKLLRYKESHIHHSLDALHIALHCCDKSGVTRRAFELKVFVVKNEMTVINANRLTKCTRLMNAKERANTQKILDDISQREARLGKSNFY